MTETTTKKDDSWLNLTDEQRDDVTRQYVQIVVDDWDTKELVRYAISQMTAYFDEGSIEELKADIDDRDKDLFDELVDNATQPSAEQPKKFIDINNDDEDESYDPEYDAASYT